jgi:hypothetical protein
VPRDLLFFCLPKRKVTKEKGTAKNAASRTMLTAPPLLAESPAPLTNNVITMTVVWSEDPKSEIGN